MDANELLKAAKGWLVSLAYSMECDEVSQEEGERDELEDLISDIEKHLGE